MNWPTIKFKSGDKVFFASHKTRSVIQCEVEDWQLRSDGKKYREQYCVYGFSRTFYVHPDDLHATFDEAVAAIKQGVTK